MRKITIHDVKQALLDHRFRKTLPDELGADVDKFLSNPGCNCNHTIYRKIMQEAAPQLREYYPSKEPQTEEEMDSKKSTNSWTVINCSTNELAERLRRLPPGRKQIDIARWQDQVTVVVNELEVEY